MEKAISASDANRKFSKLLQGVRKGLTYVVTSHGMPVAKIIPIDEHGRSRKNDRDFSAFLDKLGARPALNAGKWTRDELYDD